LRLQWRLEEHFVSCCGREKDFAEVEKILDLFPDAVTWRSKDLHGMTGLMAASFHGHSKTLQMLIDNGADINAQDNGQCTALHYALQWHHLPVIKFLVMSNAQRDVQNKEGLTPDGMLSIDERKGGMLKKYVADITKEIEQQKIEKLRQHEQKLRQDAEDTLHGTKGVTPLLRKIKIKKPVTPQKK